MSDRLATLLPPSASALDRAIETVMAERTLGLEQPITTLWNADTCPVHLLPWLAWAFSVDVWESDWPEAVKRDVIRRSIEVHRLKGTRKAVEIALDALGVHIDLAEWFEYGGEPHTFRLDAFGENVFDAGFGLDVEFYHLVFRQVDAVKPVRSHFTFRIGESFSTATHLRSGARQARRSEITHVPATRPQPVAPVAALSTGLRQCRAHRAATDAATRAQTVEATSYLRHGLRLTRVDRYTHDVLRSA